MPEKTYKGIPRSQIPWGPAIDYSKCISCNKCVDYCKLGVYEVQEKDGKQKPVVLDFDACVMFCKGCQDICPAGAISHPSRKETRDLILKLRKAKGEARS